MRVLPSLPLSPAPISPSAHARHSRPSLQRGCGLDLDGLGLEKRGDPGEGGPTGAYEDALANKLASACSFHFFHISTHANNFFRALIGTLAPGVAICSATLVHLPRQAKASRRSATSPSCSPDDQCRHLLTHLSCQCRSEVWFFVMEMAAP